MRPLFVYGPTPADKLVLPLIFAAIAGVAGTLAYDAWIGEEGFKKFIFLSILPGLLAILLLNIRKVFSQRIEFFEKHFIIYESSKSLQFEVNRFKFFCWIPVAHGRGKYKTCVLISADFSEVFALPYAEHNRKGPELNAWASKRFSLLKLDWGTFEAPASLEEFSELARLKRVS